MQDKKILVTGAGGDIGFSILKILSSHTLEENIFCADISSKNYTAIKYKNFFLLPRASAANYLHELELLVRQKSIDLIIPTSEHELRLFTKLRIDTIGKAIILMPSYESRKIGFSKYATAHFLKEQNLLAPWTFYANEEPLEYPCILKNDSGCGSKQVIIAKDREEYLFYALRNHDFIVQEYLIGEEYTCGLYRTKQGDVRSIIFKRELAGGLTKFGELIENIKISSLLENLAEKINLLGSINIQLRLTSKGPIIFEINPRFSSTVLFRDKLGFRDLIWSLEESLKTETSLYHKSTGSIKFFRIYDEVISYD